MRRADRLFQIVQYLQGDRLLTAQKLTGARDGRCKCGILIWGADRLKRRFNQRTGRFTRSFLSQA